MRLGWLVVVAACVPPSRPAATGDAPAPRDAAVDAAPIADAAPPLEVDHGPFADFPADPIVDPALPDGIAGAFTAAATGGGPCFVEPESGTLYPRNWLRPRFAWLADDGYVFELTVSTPAEANALTVITAAKSWTMPAAMWQGLATHVVDEPISVQIRSVPFDGQHATDGPSIATESVVRISRAAAPGRIVYWTPTNGSALRGFTVGDESVTDVLAPSQAGSNCIACHAATPDGAFVGFQTAGTTSTVQVRAADGGGTVAPFVSSTAAELLDRPGLERPQFSAQHYAPGDLVALANYTTYGRTDLVWTDLQTNSMEQGTGWGVLSRFGDDTRSAIGAAFAHLSDEIVYASASYVGDTYNITDGDLMLVPYGNRQGGVATPISGAATIDFNEYYPAFSPDDRYVAFDRVPTGRSAYNNALAEVFVIPAAGGEPVRLAANDPALCGATRPSPGVANSWAKWAPTFTDAGGTRTYWLAFSSARGDTSQLYVTPVVDDAGTLHTYPALHFWNQPAGDSNHTPAWTATNIVP